MGPLSLAIAPCRASQPRRDQHTEAPKLAPPARPREPRVGSNPAAESTHRPHVIARHQALAYILLERAREASRRWWPRRPPRRRTTQRQHHRVTNSTTSAGSAVDRTSSGPPGRGPRLPRFARPSAEPQHQLDETVGYRVHERRDHKTADRPQDASTPEAETVSQRRPPAPKAGRRRRMVEAQSGRRSPAEPMKMSIPA